MSTSNFIWRDRSYIFIIFLCILFYFNTFIAQIHKKNTSVKKGNPKLAHRPTKWGPLFTHQNRKTRDKHNYKQTTVEKKEILWSGNLLTYTFRHCCLRETGIFRHCCLWVTERHFWSEMKFFRISILVYISCLGLCNGYDEISCSHVLFDDIHKYILYFRGRKIKKWKSSCSERGIIVGDCWCILGW